MTARDAIKSYKDLDVWMMSMSLAESCYRVTKDFPRDEMYGMTSQVRRASASIPRTSLKATGAIRQAASSSFLGLRRGPPGN